MSRDLVIIESPGKLRTLYNVFAQIGLHADICATIGHFLENPSNLKNLAIEFNDGVFIETKRQPHRPDSFSCLRDHLRRCEGRILIATDNDQEGHVIAQDVATLVCEMGIKQPVYRMYFAGLDKSSIVNALNDLHSIEPAKAIPGTARRITDRLIGGCLSDFEHNQPVGRVQSALLGLSGNIPHSHINVKMPAADGGRPFVGELPVCGASTPAQLIAELGVFELPPAPVLCSEITNMADPYNYGDALIEFNAALDIDVEVAAELLQQMYESGDITYPRTASRGFTAAGAEAVERLARIKGLIAFKKDRIPRLQDDDSDTPHEAIRVLNESLLQRLDLGKPIKLQPTDRDAALVIIARRTIESGIQVQRDYPDLQKSHEWTRGIAWHRDIRRSILPWRAAEPASIVTHDQKAGLIDAMMHHGIGRPSTLASHAGKFMSRELVNDKYELTEKGLRILNHAPAALKNTMTSARIETLLDNEQGQVSEIINSALLVAVNEDVAAFNKIIDQLKEASNDSDEPENHYRPAF